MIYRGFCKLFFAYALKLCTNLLNYLIEFFGLRLGRGSEKAFEIEKRTPRSLALSQPSPCWRRTVIRGVRGRKVSLSGLIIKWARRWQKVFFSDSGGFFQPPNQEEVHFSRSWKWPWWLAYRISGSTSLVEKRNRIGDHLISQGLVERCPTIFNIG